MYTGAPGMSNVSTVFNQLPSVMCTHTQSSIFNHSMLEADKVGKEDC